jgi:hypothetical protein
MAMKSGNRLQPNPSTEKEKKGEERERKTRKILY